MRVLNPGQFQQVWNFLNFPAKISPRMSVEGEGGESPDLPRPHPRWPGTRPISFVNTTTNSCNPIFSQDLTNAKCSAPKVEILILVKDICLVSDQSPEGNIWFDNCCRVETFRTEKLTLISSPNFTPSGWVHNCVILYKDLSSSIFQSCQLVSE